MAATYLAKCRQQDGATVYRAVRMIGAGGADDVQAMLEKHGLAAQEITQAPAGMALDTLTAGVPGPCLVMYMQGRTGR